MSTLTSTDYVRHHTFATSTELCSWCRTINPFRKKGEPSAEALSDVYPHFPRLLQSAESGCGFCGLLRFALQTKYSDEEVEKAERIWDKLIRDSWPTRGDGCQISIWASRLWDEKEDPIHEPRLGPKNFSISICPYPPRQPRRGPGLITQGDLWFRVYAGTGKSSILQDEGHAYKN